MIRKFIGTIAIGTFVVAGIGFFRGWLNVSSSTEDTKAKLEIAVDREILHSDVTRVRTGISSFVASVLGEENAENERDELSLILQD
ncbi:MAG TPA: hypothetical protein DDW52_03805 [Planctomycetaceae bacterium]|nr:hypothetical protein [Planctomycetaceae bacterium]